MKIIAGKKLREQAIARTQIHIAVSNQRGSEVVQMVCESAGGKCTRQDYLSEERARLEVLRGIEL
jgi:hypothetical protein